MIGRAGVLDDQIGEGVGFTLPNGNIPLWKLNRHWPSRAR
jgi:hypothetical protein